VADFSNFSTVYNAAYGAAALAEVDAAAQMPDVQARGAVPETLKIKMRQQRKAAMLMWRKLKRHIVRAWAEELVKPQLEAAGLGYYKGALHNDWEQAQQLLTAGKNYIAEHAAKLNAGGMPVVFAADYDAAKNAFEVLYAQFMDGKQDAKELRNAKILANNALLKKLMKMFEDGQVIYEHDRAKRVRFVFLRVRALVRQDG
jgi:hypothetical protein